MSRKVLTQLALDGGGSVVAGSHATAPIGEIVIQRRTSTGPPTHTATVGTLCYNTIDKTLWSSDGGGVWTQIGSLTAHLAASDPHTGYVLESLVDAKGDLILGTANDVVARLGVGADNQVLTADSVAASGVKWATPAGGGGATDVKIVQTNALMLGGM